MSLSVYIVNVNKCMLKQPCSCMFTVIAISARIHDAVESGLVRTGVGQSCSRA